VLTPYVVSADHYHAIIQEMKLSEDGSSYTMIENCTVDFELAHANKGFEGIQYHEQDGGAPVASAEVDPLHMGQHAIVATPTAGHSLWLLTATFSWALTMCVQCRAVSAGPVRGQLLLGRTAWP
jgi:uncharacterized protein YjiK